MPVIVKGTSPTYARPSKRSRSRPAGNIVRKASASTSQCRKRSRAQRWRIRTMPGGRTAGASRSISAFRNSDTCDGKGPPIAARLRATRPVISHPPRPTTWPQLSPSEGRPMSVWAIADLHLSLARPDRRERYAGRWRDHAAKIEPRAGARSSAASDLVLLPGDLSMARNHRDLQPDLAWLDRLPGTKVLSAGNHDAWWNGVAASARCSGAPCWPSAATPSPDGGLVVCGTWGAPSRRGRPTPPRSRPDRELAALDRRWPTRGPSRSRRAAVRPLALPPVRPARPPRPVRRPARGGRGDRVRLRPPPHRGAMVAGRPGESSRRPLCTASPPTPSASGPLRIDRPDSMR